MDQALRSSGHRQPERAVAGTPLGGKHGEQEFRTSPGFLPLDPVPLFPEPRRRDGSQLISDWPEIGPQGWIRRTGSADRTPG